MRPTDQCPGRKRELITHSSQGEGTPSHRGHAGKRQGRQEAEGTGENRDKRLDCGFWGKEQAGRFRISLNNFNGLCGIGASFSHLVPGLGVIEAWALLLRALKEAGCKMGSGFVGLHMKGRVVCCLKELVAQGQQGPRCQSIRRERHA